LNAKAGDTRANIDGPTVTADSRRPSMSGLAAVVFDGRRDGPSRSEVYAWNHNPDVKSVDRGPPSDIRNRGQSRLHLRRTTIRQ